MAEGEHVNHDRWCFAWHAEPASTAGKDRAALVKGAKWEKGKVITVSFLDGDPSVQKRIEDVAATWTALGMANRSVEFRNTTNTLVRISFKYAGSWSTIGTTCRQLIDKTQPTMNFGWLNPASTDDELRRVVLHEFGHMLGLIHEHQNPGDVIDWNRAAVIRDLSGPPHSWSLDDIEHNMFEPYTKGETNFTKLDPLSIMMYPIPKSWTNDGFSVGLNSTFSASDKEFIHKQYP